MSSLYTMESSPLQFASFAKAFSHSLGCLIILLMASFAV